MSEFVITHRKLYFGTASGPIAYDLSADLNALSLGSGVEAKDTTRFGQYERTAIPGLRSTRLEMSGLWDADGSDEPDDVIPDSLGVTGSIITVGLEKGAAGERCEFFRASLGEYRKFGRLGEVMGFDLSAFLSNETSVPGFILGNGSVSGTGAGTAYQLGAIASGKYLYAAAHRLTAGGSVTIQIQSDDNSGFTSATTQATITLAPNGASFITPVAGPITDDYWRYNVSALSGGPHTLVTVMGIL